jgi:hypothetical protein
MFFMMIREELNQIFGVGFGGYSNPCIAKSVERNAARFTLISQEPKLPSTPSYPRN